MILADIPDELLRRFNSRDWASPRPLAASVPAPSMLNVESLPSALRDWIIDTSVRMGCPPDYLAAGIVVSLSAVIGARCAVTPKRHDTGWKVVPNLWGGLVGGPGTMKSPSLEAALLPIRTLERDARTLYESQQARFAVDELTNKLQLDACKDALRPLIKKQKASGLTPSELNQHDTLIADMQRLTNLKEPSMMRYLTNDATVEKMVELLSANPAGLLIHRDELTGLIQQWDKPDRASDRAFYLEGWNGNQPFCTDRIGRGTVHADNVCVSLIGGIQPSLLRQYLWEALTGERNDGLIQRFQVLVYPDDRAHPYQGADRSRDPLADDRLKQIARTLSVSDYLKLGAEDVKGYPRPVFRMTPWAHARFLYWQSVNMRTRVRNELLPLTLREHFSKYGSLVVSLAAVFHLIDIADGKSQPGPVNGVSMIRAVEFANYLESHARRVFSLATSGGSQSVLTLARRLEDGTLRDGFTIRDVYRHGWEHLGTKGAVEAACRELEEASWIRPLPMIVSPTGGRPSIRYEVNPAISQGGI